MIPIANAFDLIVLRCLSERGGGSASEIAGRLDRSRPYVRTRLITLAETGYVRTDGTEPRFQTYELTSTGAAVARRVGSTADV
ncbi:helix-turn-helix domain-containing protein [Halorubrum salsamenti]|uniref:helix-turn-helix domain-containing protein n=1 Tax=Halorubrum salsamenti TaxID=2583990 RepID=UPI0011A9A510|nr:helix-turn-helix domain-containing protein [Halorubrum salsamenti]